MKDSLAIPVYPSSLCFISHMVQMKVWLLSFAVQSPQLYIPHGSDESSQIVEAHLFKVYFISHMVQMKDPPRLLLRHGKTFSLYPTWFRWKYSSAVKNYSLYKLYIPHGSDESDSQIVEAHLFKTYFISHMVQMKVLKETPLKSKIPYLYIPHGSDESGIKHTWGNLKSSFISHMVQMKATLDNSVSVPEKFLYIPHGSDERQWKFRFFLTRKSFISHMVQMKGSLPIRSTKRLSHFISHMVQMKGTFNFWLLSFKFLTLYPTWFRWKESSFIYFLLPELKLYIPHGSDERSNNDSMLFASSSFISHMVQMKGHKGIVFGADCHSFISHMVQMKVGEAPMRRTSDLFLYIPHGSDERYAAVMAFEEDPALYIPHGSDESRWKR